MLTAEFREIIMSDTVLPCKWNKLAKVEVNKVLCCLLKPRQE